MKYIPSFKRQYINWIILFCVLVFTSFFFWMFLNKTTRPIDDSGIFLYIGQEMLRGKILYTQLWDSKPPLIFFINAAGLYIGNGTLWGLWLEEYISLLFAVSILYFLLRKFFGIIPVLLSIFACLSAFFIFTNGGNYTEEFAFPFQSLAIYCFLNIFVFKTRIRSSSFFLGICFAVTFLLKQHLIGIFISMTVYAVLYSKQILLKHFRKILLFSLLGITTITAPIAFYLIKNNALINFWDVAFLYNLFYSNTPINTHVYSGLLGFRFLMTISGMFYISILGYTLGFIAIIRKNKFPPIIILALIGFPIEVIFASISGKGYPHYYVAWLPVCTILSCYTIQIFFGYLKNFMSYSSTINPTLFIKIFILGLTIFLMIFYSMNVYILAIKTHGRIFSNNKIPKIIPFILRTTSPDDYLLAWGLNLSINYTTQRKSPTRYVNQIGLYRNGYHDKYMIMEFLKDLKKNKPKLIIDNNTYGNWVPPLSCERKRIYHPFEKNNSILPEMNTVFQYLCSHYKYIKTLDGWRIYKNT